MADDQNDDQQADDIAAATDQATDTADDTTPTTPDQNGTDDMTTTPDTTPTTPAPADDTTPDAPTPVDAFLAAHAAWAADPTADPAAVLTAYRAVPGGARAAAARRAMSAAMRAGADPDRVADLDDALSAPAPSAPRPSADPVDVMAARVAALDLALAIVRADIAAADLDASAVQDRADVILAAPADLTSPVLARAAAAAAAVARGGAGGARQSVDRDLANVPAGTAATYRDTTAVVRDGAVWIGTQSFGSLSAAGRHVNGGTAVNGWAVWTTGGRSMAARYDAADWAGAATA